MRYDLTQPILDLHKHQIKDAETPEGYTLGLVLERASVFMEQGNNPAGEVKLKQFQLGLKIADAMADGHVDLTTEEMGTLRAAVGKMYMPTIVGRVFSMLDVHSGTDKPN